MKYFEIVLAKLRGFIIDMFNNYFYLELTCGISFSRYTQFRWNSTRKILSVRSYFTYDPGQIIASKVLSSICIIYDSVWYCSYSVYLYVYIMFVLNCVKLGYDFYIAQVPNFSFLIVCVPCNLFSKYITLRVKPIKVQVNRTWWKKCSSLLALINGRF